MKNTFEYLHSLKPVADTLKHDEARVLLLDAITDRVNIEGIICEFGVAEGSSARHIIRNFPGSEIYLFDSFKGLPEDWQPGFHKGRYAVANIPVFKEKNVTLLKGLFADTLENFNPENRLNYYTLIVIFIHQQKLYSSIVMT